MLTVEKYAIESSAGYLKSWVPQLQYNDTVVWCEDLYEARLYDTETSIEFICLKAHKEYSTLRPKMVKVLLQTTVTKFT